ncbi:hypothetical protein FNV43_RR26425 [Rhamnella rubrinervis]|uniref:Uncharacterized protein n=1 Tax=Rhamnella rubrinervis TaxID=2594499 RepID=A0A8K0DMJ9_9ROSA|nr:hypothetical protein FNV43_RR26425 [Rhamnella rubrinervis]
MVRGRERNQALGGELEGQSHGFEAGIGEDLSCVDEFRELTSRFVIILDVSTLMVALIAVLELKTEGKNASVFDSHPLTMVIFCVIFAIYGILLLTDELVQQPNENDYGGVMPKAILCSGSLGVVILFLIIIPVLGWSLLILWNDAMTGHPLDLSKAQAL